ncbi:MAG: protease complex subunit PrcB family protein [Gammaproteobacteria bacterium]|nr:protease complex subunit PrcB family protein [Gammaproteobacteria bacterium]
MRKLISILLIGLIATACTTPPPPPESETQPSFTVIDQGVRSGLTIPKHLVINTNQDWQELWNVHQSFRRRTPPAPPIDFTKEMIIAVFAGERPTGGHSVKVQSLQITPSWLLVNLHMDTPPQDTITTMQLTQPYVIIKTAKTPLRVEFVWDKDKS